MSVSRTERKIGAWTAALALGAAALMGDAREARAEGPVVGTAKGVVGGAMLGGEGVAIGMGLFGVSKGWPYLVFPTVGAIGGGIGGYFVEQAAPAEVPLYMLAGGMALVIPTLIVTLNATIYRAPEIYPGEPVTNTPAPESPQPTTGKLRGPRVAHAPRGPRPMHIPMSLFDVHDGRVALGLPAVEIRPVYTQEELAKFGVAQAREIKIPVFAASF
jgi:hypothetical protein